MLPQKNRITVEEFPSIVKEGKRLISPNLTLVFKKNNTFFKATVVISKKTSKKATARNIQKRKLREAIRNIFSLGSEMPYSCIFFIKKDIAGTSPSLLIEELHALSKKIS